MARFQMGAICLKRRDLDDLPIARRALYRLPFAHLLAPMGWERGLDQDHDLLPAKLLDSLVQVSEVQPSIGI